MSSYARANVYITNDKKQKANSHEGITWSEMGKQNIQVKEVYSRGKFTLIYYHKLAFARFSYS